MATKSRTGSQSATSNQLSLFSEPTEAELVDNLIEESIDARNDDTHTTGTQDTGTLETPSPDDGREAGQWESTSAGGFRSAGVDGESAIRVDGGSEDGLPIRVGDRDEGMGVPPRRGGPAPLVVRSSDSRPTSILARDLRITSAHGIGEGGLKQKAEANLAAIRTLKTLEAESRAATPEEKAVLVKYTGWGAMPNAFASLPSRDWQSVADELKDLLNAEEYASARASTPNAHYTSSEVIQAIWQTMEQFGLKPRSLGNGLAGSAAGNLYGPLGRAQDSPGRVFLSPSSRPSSDYPFALGVVIAVLQVSRRVPLSVRHGPNREHMRESSEQAVV